MCSAQDDVDLILTVSNLLLATESETGTKIFNVDTVVAKLLEKSVSELICTDTITGTMITPECNFTLNIA